MRSAIGLGVLLPLCIAACSDSNPLQPDGYGAAPAYDSGVGGYDSGILGDDSGQGAIPDAGIERLARDVVPAHAAGVAVEEVELLAIGHQGGAVDAVGPAVDAAKPGVVGAAQSAGGGIDLEEGAVGESLTWSARPSSKHHCAMMHG